MLPHCAADWSFNLDPARTLARGFASAAARRAAAEADPEAAARLAAHASLGADATHGHFWIIGACHALLAERTLAECQALELRDAPDPEAAARRARDLARQLRRRTGLNVIALTPEASRLMKAIRFRMPPRAVYADLAAIYDALGPEGAAMAARYRRAADWLWGTARPARPQAGTARTPALRKAGLAAMTPAAHSPLRDLPDHAARRCRTDLKGSCPEPGIRPRRGQRRDRGRPRSGRPGQLWRARRPHTAFDACGRKGVLLRRMALAMTSRRRATAMRMTFDGFLSAFIRATKPDRKPSWRRALSAAM